MSQQYAKDQPSGFTNRIERVAIVGAGGRIGKHFAEALLATGKHTVTAITRKESTSVLPTGIKKAIVDYDDEASLISALQGQQFLVITLSVMAPAASDPHGKIVRAAAKAGVPYIMPNAYGGDFTNKSLADESLYGAGNAKNVSEIERLGVSSWVALCCGFWYEWSLALGEPWFGFDIANRKVTFFDDGLTKINISTWEQCGRALAALLSFKELPEDEHDTTPTISRWKNNLVYISSFRISQRDMLDSIERVDGSKDEDWEITNDPTVERWKKGIEDMKKGDRRGFARAMYSRYFYQNGDGDFESSKGLANQVLGLPVESLDEATKKAVEMVKSGWNPFAQ